MKSLLNKVSVLYILLFLTLLLSCQKEKEVTVILITPYQLIINDVQPADVVSLLIDCQSPDELKQFTVTSRLEGHFSTTELDTLISGKRFFFRYEYVVPYLMESDQILLEFTLRDVVGNIATNAKIIDVTATAKYLKETSGHELFSGKSGKQNAYNILTGTPLYSHLADSAVMHIADTSDSQLLLKRWVSPAGVRFVRFNGFDYANATDLSIRNAFDSGLKSEFVNSLIIGDILLIRISNKTSGDAYVAIKVVNIIDDTESDLDRYIFNIKR